jgi:serine/threonine-protein kinase RsbW
MRDYQPDSASATHPIQETIASRRDSVDGASERIMQAVERLPCARGSLDDISLALSEALANAVIHGNREDPNKKVDICALCDSPDQFRLVITDEGQGFQPDAVPDPTLGENTLSNHGRGLFLIRRLMDETEFRLGGRQIVLLKRCADSSTPS